MPRTVADALEYFSEPVKNARLIAAKDASAIAEKVGGGAREISDHCARIHTGLRVVKKLLNDSTDNDEVRVLLELLDESGLELCNRVFDFGGAALVALELPKGLPGQRTATGGGHD